MDKCEVVGGVCTAHQQPASICAEETGGWEGFTKDFVSWWVSNHVTKHVDGPAEECPQDECAACALKWCPDKDPMHYHHDGCPSCAASESQ